MRSSTRTLVACVLGFALSLAAGAAPAGAQCAINGPTQICRGDSIELCGPTLADGNYLWQGPDGSLYMTDCILVYDPGLYTMKYRDRSVGLTWVGPCSLTVVSANPDAPAITGDVSVCNGSTVQWCGPTGNFEYLWNGPNGFSATTSCVNVGVAGDYQLRLRAMPLGCWGDTTVRTLAVTNCGGGNHTTNCPKPAWWWAAQSVSREHSSRRIDPLLVDRVASCVDDHDADVQWSNPADGFRRLMMGERRSLRTRAERQVAAVWANICAGDIGIVAREGSSVSLDPSTTISLRGVSGSVANWLSNANAELARLNGRRESRSVNESYRSLIRTGWCINHGVGIGATCNTPVAHVSTTSTPVEDASMAMAMAMVDDQEPLSVEVLDESSGPLTFGDLTPNPFSSMTRLGFAISSTTSQDVLIGVYDVSGRLVRELARGQYAPGQYETRWDGRATDGAPAKSGLYFIIGRVGGQQIQTRVSFVH